MISIADIFSADISAYYLCGSRIKKINEDKDFNNVIICPPGKYSNKLKESGFSVYEIPIEHSKISFREDRKAVKQLKNLLKRIKPDIVHTHNSKGGAIGRLAAHKADIPVIIHQVHGFYFRRHKGFKRYAFAQMEKYLSKKCNIMLFQNKEDLKVAKRLGFNKNTNLYFLDNGIDFSDFRRPETKKSPAEEGVLRLVYVGRMDKNKNHEMAFKALEEMDSNIPFELHLVGDGPLFETHKKRITSSNKLKDKVFFYGHIDRKEISSITKKCHINLLTSKQEGKPRTAMEAAYMGIPTIATDIEGTREVVIPGITGELVPFNDCNMMRDKIVKLFEDKEYWKKLSKSCKEYAAENFDEDKIVQKLMMIYKLSLEKNWKELDEYFELR